MYELCSLQLVHNQSFIGHAVSSIRISQWNLLTNHSIVLACITVCYNHSIVQHALMTPSLLASKIHNCTYMHHMTHIIYLDSVHCFFLQLYMTIQTECLEDSFFSGLKLALRHRSQIPSHFIMYVMMCALCELYWMSVAIDHGVRIKNLHQLSHVLLHWNIIYHVDLCPSFQRLQPHCCAPQFNFNVCYYPNGIS